MNKENKSSFEYEYDISAAAAGQPESQDSERLTDRLAAVMQ